MKTKRSYGDYSEEWYTLLLGDFGLSADQLDERLRDDAPESRRISTNPHMDTDHPNRGAFLCWNGPGSPRVIPIPTDTTEDSTWPILIEIKLPSRDWTPLAFPTAVLPTINEPDAPPEVQQLTTKGGHDDDRKK